MAVWVRLTTAGRLVMTVWVRHTTAACRQNTPVLTVVSVLADVPATHPLDAGQVLLQNSVDL